MLLSLIDLCATLCFSIMDATAILTHNIENTFFDNKIMSVLAFDIKGAFDKLKDTQIIKRF